MLALHVEFLGHPVALIGVQIFVERLVVARNTAPYARGMGRKDGLNPRQTPSNVKQSQAGHPFVAVINDLQGVVQLKMIETFHHLARRV